MAHQALADDGLSIDPEDLTVQVTVRHRGGGGYVMYPALSFVAVVVPVMLADPEIDSVTIDKTGQLWPEDPLAALSPVEEDPWE